MAAAVVQASSGVVLGAAPTNGNIVSVPIIGTANYATITDSNSVLLTDENFNGAGDFGTKFSDVWDYTVPGSPTKTYAHTGGTLVAPCILEISGCTLSLATYFNSLGSGLCNFACEVGDVIVSVGMNGNPVLTGVSGSTALGATCQYGIATGTSGTADATGSGGDTCSVAVYTQSDAATGTAATVQDDQHVSASGMSSVPVPGSAAPRQDRQHATAAGAIGARGSGATRQDDQHVSAAGLVAVPITTAGATRQDDQHASGAGVVSARGTGATKQDHQRISADGKTDFQFAQSLQKIVPSYPYQEYADDQNIVAFFTAYNTLAQSYLDWFNATPLAIYVSPNISGALLDWIATGIYGIERPVFSSQTTKYIAGLNSLPLGVGAVNGNEYFQSGTATIATDDFYKRVLTWWLYAGDGRYFNVELLRLKVARFLFGVNGTDVTLTQAEAVSIQPQNLPSPAAPTLASTSGGSIAARTYGAQGTYVTALGETLPSSASSLAVSSNHLLIVDSPPAESGAVDWNVYVNVLSTNPAKFIAGLNSMPVNGYAVNGTNKGPVSPPTRQNVAPIPIGTNWTEPTSGLIVGAALPSANTSNMPGNFIVVVPRSAASVYLEQALGQMILSFPFQYTATVVLT